jgi:hypothetical protein
VILHRTNHFLGYPLSRPSDIKSRHHPLPSSLSKAVREGPLRPSSAAPPSLVGLAFPANEVRAQQTTNEEPEEALSLSSSRAVAMESEESERQRV